MNGRCNLMMRAIVAGVGALATIAPSAPVHAKAVQYSGRFAAKYPHVAELKSLGIMAFKGQDGENFVLALTSELQSAQIDGRPVFSIKTDENAVARSAGDMSKAEVAAAIRKGQQLGVAGIFAGTITAATVTSANYTIDNTECVQTEKLFQCKQSRTVKVPCQKVSAVYSVAPRVIRIDNAALIYSATINSEGSYSVCNGVVQDDSANIFANIFAKKDAAPKKKIKATTPEALLAEVRKDAVEQIRAQVAPYNQTISVVFKDRAPDLQKTDQAQFTNAMSFADIGRLDRACGTFETLYAGKYQSSLTLLYNMGVCREALEPDNPAAAFEFYAKADQLMVKPDKMISEAYQRMKGAIGTSRAIQ